jgi:hypothetical protein
LGRLVGLIASAVQRDIAPGCDRTAHRREGRAFVTFEVLLPPTAFVPLFVKAVVVVLRRQQGNTAPRGQRGITAGGLRQQAILEKGKKAERHHEEDIFSGIRGVFFEIMTGVQQDCFCFRRDDFFFLYDGLWKVWEYRGLVKKSMRFLVFDKRKNTFLSCFNCFNGLFKKVICSEIWV